MKAEGYSILHNFADYTMVDEVPDVNERRPSKFSFEMCAGTHDWTHGTVMEESTSTANADLDLSTSVVDTGNGAQDEAKMRSGGSWYISRKNPLKEAL